MYKCINISRTRFRDRPRKKHEEESQKHASTDMPTLPIPPPYHCPSVMPDSAQHDALCGHFSDYAQLGSQESHAKICSKGWVARAPLC